MTATSFAALQLLRVLPRVQISRAVGRLCEQPLPPRVSRVMAQAYAAAYGVDMEEARPEPEGYANFDSFFTRQLREGARAIAPASVVSPADGTLSSVGRVDDGARLAVKDQLYDVAELTGHPEDTARYRGGMFAVVYLSPRDYHRVHSPVDGNIRLVRGIPGDLFPVNRVGSRYVRRLLVRNNRVSIVIETEALGCVTVVLVGATIVGRISVKALAGRAVPPGVHEIEPFGVRRGDEIGVFHLGSTAVLLLEEGVVISRSPGAVRYGESLLTP